MLNQRLLTVLRTTKKISSTSYSSLRHSKLNNFQRHLSKQNQICINRNALLPSNVKNYSTEQTEEEPTCFDVADEYDFRSRVLESKIPVIVDFQADWCGPCKQLGPLLESLVQSKNGKVLLAKVDVDCNSEIAMEYDVTAVPTVLALIGGNPVDKFMGAKPELEVDAFIERIIEKHSLME